MADTSLPMMPQGMTLTVDEGPNAGQYVVSFDFLVDGQRMTFFVPLLSASKADAEQLRRDLDAACRTIVRTSHPRKN